MALERVDDIACIDDRGKARRRREQRDRCPMKPGGRKHERASRNLPERGDGTIGLMYFTDRHSRARHELCVRCNRGHLWVGAASHL